MRRALGREPGNKFRFFLKTGDRPHVDRQGFTEGSRLKAAGAEGVLAAEHKQAAAVEDDFLDGLHLGQGEEAGIKVAEDNDVEFLPVIERGWQGSPFDWLFIDGAQGGETVFLDAEHGEQFNIRISPQGPAQSAVFGPQTAFDVKDFDSRIDGQALKFLSIIDDAALAGHGINPHGDPMHADRRRLIRERYLLPAGQRLKDELLRDNRADGRPLVIDLRHLHRHDTIGQRG